MLVTAITPHSNVVVTIDGQDYAARIIKTEISWSGSVSYLVYSDEIMQAGLGIQRLNANGSVDVVCLDDTANALYVDQDHIRLA